ncbi:CTP synthase [compost metagenome]
MKIGIIGEYNPSLKPHAATDDAMRHSLHLLQSDIQWVWISTEEILSNRDVTLNSCKGFWIAPGSPYKSMQGAIEVIKHCRENHIPLLGTCGGFQHIVVEYARNILSIEDAEHAEYSPYSSNQVVSKLECSLAGKVLEIHLDKESKTFEIYGTERIEEKYYCSFGLNPSYQSQLHEAGLRTVGYDDNNETRIVESSEHSFFVGTLFVPQMRSTIEHPHRLITEFIKQVIKN